MNISIVGTGYVGLVTGTCLAELGHTVNCIDINKVKIDNLNDGIVPIYEPGLKELIAKNTKSEKLTFSTSYDSIEQADVVFCAVGTPSDANGNADLQYVFDVAREFGKHIKKHSIISTKSTVPVGTAMKIKSIVQKILVDRNETIEFEVVSNPEFLKEGSAIEDFMNPDRIVIGCDNEYSEIVMKSVYKAFEEEKILVTSIPSAEMIKYASNSMLAVRISFMNDIANLCDTTGANVEDVAKGMGLDSRIGPKFLKAGCGYGGSCFPKDVKALIRTGEENRVDMCVIRAAEDTNNMQKHILYRKLYNASSKVNYPIKTIAILGTAFKPNTDDMREAPSITLVNDLLNDNCKIGPFEKIKLSDPIALENAKKIIGETNEKIEYCEELDKAIMDSDVLIIVTEWKQIKEMDMTIVKRLMKGNIIIDGRNVFDRKYIESLDFVYEGIGK